MTTALLCAFFYILGASSAFIYAMVRIPKPPGITKHARRDQREFVQRKYRDAEIVATVAEWVKPCIACRGGDFPCICKSEVGGIDYRFINMTGEER